MKKKQKIILYRIIITAVMLVVLQFLPITGIPRLIAYLAAYLVIGYDILRKAGKGILNGRAFDENFLMALATLGAFFLAIWTKSGDYLEGIAVMLFYQIGELFQSYAVGKSRKNISALMDIRPDYANIERDGRLEQVDPEEVAVGSVIVVQPGEKIPLDGQVIEGSSTLNTSALTGESLPREVQAGEAVISGCINMTGVLKLRTTKEFGESTVSRILDLVENASSRKSRSEDFISKFARFYTPAVCCAALALALLPPLGPMLFLVTAPAWGTWLYRALTFLVIICPCALVISTPVSIVSGMAAATRYGILIKGGMFLEQGRRLDCLALDKTGTLTHGKPRQTDCLCTGQEDEAAVRSLAASLAARSDHPVSGAIAQAALADHIPLQDVDDFTALPGQGVSGIMAGRRWYLGNRALAASLGRYPADLDERISRLEQQGKTVVALVGDNGIRALFAVADTLKASSLEAVRELKALGVTTVMLTGDNEHTAAAIARQVGVDSFKAGLLPADKLAVIEELEARGHKVGMVGDGINDAPALARADVGFAMAGNGTDTAIETADVALMDDDLRKIPRFIRLSRATFAILVQNITLALGVKALFFALTFTGHATMWMAVFADVGTALLVVANGLRAMRQ